MTHTADPITVQVIRAALDGIVQEMQTSLFRTGFSTIIRESHDASCAILNTKAEVIAQHVVLPLHMGAFPACAEGLLERFPPDDLREGDAYIVNHPYRGGSPHAPRHGRADTRLLPGRMGGLLRQHGPQERHRRHRTG